MSMVRAMVWKEIHSFLHDWRILVAVVILPLAIPWFPFFVFSAPGPGLSANAGLVASSLFVVVLVANTLTWRSFSHERGENALTSVLASPISVMELFLGKSLAVFLFGYLSLLVAVIATACGLDIRTGALPDVSAFAMALLGVPVCGLAVIEVMGAFYLLIGDFGLVRYIGLALAVVIFGIAADNQEATFDFRLVLAVTVVGMAAAVVVVVPVLFSKVSKPRLAK
jgi:ABC-2 type transport system permease protein